MLIDLELSVILFNTTSMLSHNMISFMKFIK